MSHVIGETEDCEDCWVGGDVYCDGNCANWPIERILITYQIPGIPEYTKSHPDESEGYVYPTHNHCNGSCM